MSTSIRFSSDRVIMKEHGGIPVGSQAARDVIERVKQQIRPKKGRKAQGISLVDTRPPKQEATT